MTAVSLIAIAGTVLADPGGLFSGGDNPWPYNAPTDAPVIATVGDISCQPGSPQEAEKKTDTCDQGVGSTARNAAQTATANQVEAMKPALVAVLGDLQYQNGYLQDFQGSYDTTWGAFKFLQRPSPGNHEFYTNHGQTGVRGEGYFDYFNGYQHNADGTVINDTFPTATGGSVTQPRPRQDGQAGQFGANGNGWYSYDIGNWHLISLNVECAVQPGGCDPNGSWFSSETQWLAQDLSLDDKLCTLAYWHQPTFSSTVIGNFTSDSAEGQAADAWWNLLYAHHADLIVNGHDHVYTRFAPMDPSGNLTPRRGIREFIVGTGGESLDTLNPAAPNVQASADQYYGVMKLTLQDRGYKWDYESAMVSPTAPAGTPATYSDTGSANCHSPGFGLG